MELTAAQQSDLDEAKAAADLLMGRAEALRELNHYVVGLMRETDRRAGQRALSDFHVGETVWFFSEKRGRAITGRVVRINPKSVGLDVNGTRWRVHWSHLNKGEPSIAQDGSVLDRGNVRITRTR